MSIYMTAAFQVQPGMEAVCLAAIRDFITYIKANEPGTRQYTSVRNADDPTQFLHFFHFDDEAAMEAHRTSDGVRRFTDILYPNLVDGVTFTNYEGVSST